MYAFIRACWFTVNSIVLETIETRTFVRGDASAVAAGFTTIRNASITIENEINF